MKQRNVIDRMGLLIRWKIMQKRISVKCTPKGQGVILVGKLEKSTWMDMFSIGTKESKQCFKEKCVQKHPFEGTLVNKSNLDHYLISSATCSNQVPSCRMGYVLFIWNFSIEPLACIDGYGASPGGSDGKESASNSGDPALVPVLGSSGEGHGNPLQYSCLGNPTDRGAWWATVHGVTKSRR